MPNKSLTQTPAWQALLLHCKALEGKHIRDLFAQDDQRFEKFHVRENGLLLDFSKHCITDDTLSLLQKLAEECSLSSWRAKMFSGEKINTSENRAVLHTALRGTAGTSDYVDESLARLQDFTTKIRREKKFTDIVSIGIGGPDLGPRMVYEALKDFTDGPHLHFVSNMDPVSLSDALAGLNPQSTMIAISSKTFATLETLDNAANAKSWLEKSLGKNASQHLYAATANIQAAQDFGVPGDHIFELKEWVGGRYSLWSAAAFPVTAAIGFENFQELLRGARDMDAHFLNAPTNKNIPVLMALLGLWYRNFWDYGAYAVLPYAQRLHDFPAYLQQLDMESNGKSVSRSGHELDHKTGPVVFGGVGTNAQHAFFQLLHQGTDIIPCDFILIADKAHEKLNANALAHAQALMQGKTHGQPHEIFKGNRPSSTLILDRLDPYHLGLLIVAYEHKVFVQGVLWGVNSFDQWGVELGKTLAQALTKFMSYGKNKPEADQSTLALLDYVKQKSTKN